MIYNNILETIGNTPIIKLNKVILGIDATILVKVESFNPGHSVKDRMALKMIEDAEKDGKISPGGTIIEGTSGNKGMGLALVAAIKGYKSIFVINDKQSQEKINALKALGAEVVVCPANVEPEDPRSYYSTAARIHKETPNSFYPNQYKNPSNTQAHYETTGPEIWDQTQGKITHFVAGVGTGGTISGTSKYLKEKNKDLYVLGIDTYGSVFKKYKETGEFDKSEIYPYLTEGIGEDILPENVDFDLIDRFEKVTDKESAIMTRRMAREEGLFIGWSCGAAVHGALEFAKKNLTENDTMVILLPDHGTRYLNKIYNDDWMKSHGFLEKREYPTANDIIGRRKPHMTLLTIDINSTVGDAIKLMSENYVSQVPVTENDHIVGSVNDSNLLSYLMEKPEALSQKVHTIMEKPFTFVGLDSTVDVLSSLITKQNKALLVRDENKTVHIITQADLLMSIKHKP